MGFCDFGPPGNVARMAVAACLWKFLVYPWATRPRQADQGLTRLAKALQGLARLAKALQAGLLLKLQDDHPVDKMIYIDFLGFGSMWGPDLGRC